MKYAIISPADQTIVLYHPDGDTTVYADAHLFDSREEAQIVLDEMNARTREYQTKNFGKPLCEEWSEIEEVADEESWRAQEDTW